jgi:1,4-alpha-glucan branching enzyme
MVSILENGRVAFTTYEPKAKHVLLVGAFGGWQDERFPMVRDDEGHWSLEIDPGPGLHLFRYAVDGEWKLDLAAHGCCLAADGTPRSRLYRPPTSLSADAIAA